MGKLGKLTYMGQRYLSRWMSWSGTPTTPPGTPSKSSPIEGGGGMPLSPQPPRVVQGRARTPSKGSTASAIEKKVYPLVPKLPVPPLGHTLTWYLASLQPVLDSELMKEAEEIVLEFGKPGSVGEKIQESLIKRHDAMDNWAYQWWLDDMYLNIRLPLPINSNPCMTFPRQDFKTTDDMLYFAALFVNAVFDMKERIEANDLDVDRCNARERHQPMCMEQYSRVFTTYRRPGIPKDKQISNATAPKDNQHIIVLLKNHVFRINIVTNGARMSIKTILKQLKEVYSFVDQFEESDPPPIGIMTGDNRSTWAQNRQILIGEPLNQTNLNIIESSVMAVCLDDPLPKKFNLSTQTSHRASLTKRASSFTVPNQQQENVTDRDEVNAGHQVIHGGGFNHNSANRWFDKSMQLIVTKDGWCGICFEHSPAEGIVIIQLVEQVLQNLKEDSEDNKAEVFEGGGEEKAITRNSESNTSIKEAENEMFESPSRMEWKVTPIIWRRIQESSEAMDRLVDDFDLRIIRYTGYGRNYIKKTKHSPDAYIQVVLQLAYFRTHGRLTSTYESASTRRFRCGRVDSIRSNTPQVLSWCESMVLNAPASDRLAKFETAISTQVDIMVNNILGRGIDIHLLSLREMATEMGMDRPEIFNHKSYQEANHFRLSTSQVSTVSDSWIGYGAVCPDGYGAAYNPHPDYIVFCLTAFNSCESTSTLEFGRNLERALDDVRALLDIKPGGAK